jgi:putative nucleotidyltransferase with HDIG domain
MKGTKEKKLKKPKIKVKPEELRAYGVLLLFGFLSALSIQIGFGYEETLGSFLIASLLLGILLKDIRRYRPQYLNKPGMLALLGLMVVFTMGLSRLTWYSLDAFSRGIEIEHGSAAVFGLPMPSGAMLVTLLFDFHTAIIFSFVISLLAGLWMADPTLAVYVFVGSITAAFSMISCKKRTAILRGGALVLGANALTLIAIQLFGGVLFTPATPAALMFATFSAVSVIAIVSLTLPVLEYLFKVTTDISLLELLDLDHPLMKGLMISAPGTYHHSIIVGNLVEAATESVGVNTMLARAGAYYHDIGKMKMPEYFIENQPWGVSKHDKLTPHMSSMILTSHVKEGVELAKQHKLPEVIIDIIQQHHGNALITYFYEKAKVQPNGSDLSEHEYRYPGPRPQSRISALIMMADAVEASSRVLTDPTPSRIAALVDRIINHIFLAGQLDECELTLKDIYEVKNRFTYILTGILHKRVDYPGFDFSKDTDGNTKQSSKEDKAKHPADREGLPESPQATGPQKGRA